MNTRQFVVAAGFLLSLAAFQTVHAQRQFFSNFDDGTADWNSTFQNPAPVATETGGQLQVRATFPATVGFFTNSVTFVEWRRDVAVRSGQTLEYRVDLIGTSRGDVFAGMYHTSRSTSDSRAEGFYNFFKNESEVYVLKRDLRTGDIALFLHEKVTTKHEHVVLSMSFTELQRGVLITVRVLDKEANEAVLLERKFMDTPGIDSTADSTWNLDPDPGPAYLNGAWHGLYLAQLTDGNQPEAQVVYDNFSYDYIDPFTKITTGEIVTDASRFLTASWGDYDNDGVIDLFVTTSVGQLPNSLYRNRKDGTFERVMGSIVVQDGVDSSVGVWGDIDNDGDLDLFVNQSDGSTIGPGPNALYINTGAGEFRAVTEGAVVTDLGTAQGAAWGDYDNDGALDLLAANGYRPGERNLLYHNNGDGTFERTLPDPIEYAGDRTGVAAWTDYDNDGDLDVFIAGILDNQNEALYRNDGGGKFSRITSGNPIVTSGGNSLDGDWGDYDNDGDLDLFVSNQSNQSDFHFRNEGDGNFTRITAGPHVSDTSQAAGVAWLDYDNDGHLDLYVVRVTSPDRLHRNNGNGTFSTVSSRSLASKPADARTAFMAVGDYDNDGFTDVFVTAGAFTGTGGSSTPKPNHLYRNTGNHNNWIKLKLVGTASNRSAIGAKVRVKATIGGKTFWQMREISGGGGGQNDMRSNFGLGDAAMAETIRIEWPSGTVQELHNIAAKQILTITEPPKLIAEGDSNRVFRFKLIGAAGLRYRIQFSPDFQTWEQGYVVTNTTRSIQLIHDYSTAGSFGPPRGFFRAVQEQP